MEGISIPGRTGFMNADLLLFFDGKPGALALYEAFAARVFDAIPDASIRVLKTEIPISCRRRFGAVSLLPVRRKALRPDPYITVSFGLPYRVESPRIDAASEPYPNRWTHHVLLGSADEIDDELMSWILEAAAFSASKR